MLRERLFGGVSPFVMSVEGEPADPPPGGGGAEKPWYDGADAEIVGHLQTKGWHDKPANEVALEAIRAHREAEKYLGVPADRVLKLPKDSTDADGWKGVWGKLGVPEAADKYDLSGVKFSDGTELDEGFVNWFRNVAHANNVPAASASALAGELVKFLEESDSADTSERSAKIAEEKKTLDASWGANKEGNLFIAKQAANKLGISPEAVQALENQVGYAAVMQMFLKVGQSMGEGRYVSGDGLTKDGVLTREQAVARRSSLENDASWVKKYLAGDAAAVREMTALNTLIVGDDTAASREF